MRKNLAIIALTAGALLLVLFFVFHLHQTSKEEVLSHFNENQLQMTQEDARSIQRYFRSRSQDLRWLAYIASREAFDKDKITDAIQSNFNRLKMAQIQEVSLLNENGTVVYSTIASAEGKNHSRSDFFSWAKNPGNQGAVRIWHEKTGGSRTPVTAGSPAPPRIEIFLATPLYRESAGGRQTPGGKFAGALMLTVDLEKMLAERSPSLNPATKMHKLWIIERGGTLLVHSGHPEMVMRDIRKRDKTCNECHFSFDYIETILGKAEGTIEYQIKGESKKIAAFTPMTFEKTSWIIVVNAPLDEVTAFEWENLKETLFLLGAVAFLLGLAFFTTYRNYRQKVVGEMEVQRLRDQQKLMEKLRESEENYRNLFDNANEAIFVAQDGKLVFINPITTKMVGFSVENLLSRSFVEFIHPDDRGMVIDRHHRRIKGEELPQIYSFRIIRGDGKVIWIELNTVVVIWKGKPATLNYLSDITEIKQTAEALRESEERFRTLSEKTPLGMSLIDIDGRYEYVNPAFVKIFGYDLSDISTGKEWFRKAYPDPESRRKVMADWKEDLGRYKNLEIRPRIYDVRCKGGAFRTIMFRPVTLPSGKQFIIYEDITEQKRAEQTQALLVAMLDATPGFVGFADAKDTHILYINPTGRKMVGVQAQEDVTQLKIADVHPEWTNKLFRDEIIPTAIRDGMWTGESAFLNRDGHEIPVMMVLLAHKSPEGEMERFSTISIDITDRKRTEEENRSLQERLQRSEKMEALGTLAGGVAHDLNNVLGIVVGYAEITLDAVDKSSPLRPSLVNIMSGGLKAAAIVDDLLTLARRGVPGRSILNLNKIIADCQKSPELADLSFHHPSVKIKTDLDPDLLNISGSSVHLDKSLYNLVSNASEAMAKGGLVTIKTSNQYVDRPIHGYDQIRAGDYVVLSVSDTGEGIHEADLTRIFEPFYTKKVMGRSGTGLGLAVVWGTVKDHNGYINVESEKGKGSTFTLYFPVTREEIAAETVSVAISEYTGQSESILVVDDVKEQRDLAAGMLRTLNYNVSSVSSGEAAVAYMKEHKVDLMVLDMIMDPGMDGLDTYKCVLEIHPKQKAIIVSGFSESDLVKTAHGLGAGAYVRKPYIKEKLGLAVRKELDRSG